MIDMLIWAAMHSKYWPHVQWRSPVSIDIERYGHEVEIRLKRVSILYFPHWLENDYQVAIGLIDPSEIPF